MSDPAVTPLLAQLAAQQVRIAQLEQELAASRQAAAPPPPHQAVDNTLFHAIFEGAGIGMGIIDMQGRIVVANRSLENMLGYEKHQMQGLHVLAISVPEDGEKDTALLTRLRAGEFPYYQMEKRYIRRDGSLLHGRLTVSLAHEHGVEAFVIGQVEDITEQKNTLAALEKGQTLFHKLAEHLDVVFWLHDVKENRTIYESPAFEVVWGRSVADALSDPRCFVKSVFPEDRPIVRNAFEQSLAGQYTVCEYRIMRPDGEIRYILDKGFPIYDADGAVAQIAGLAADITEEKLTTASIRRLNESLEQHVLQRTQALQEALTELGEQREFFRQITESMREGVLVFDSNRMIEYANPYASELTGIPLNELIGGRDRLRELAADPEAAISQLGARPNGPFGDFEIALRQPDGGLKHVRVMSAARIQKGKLAGGVAVLSDQTQHRQAEERLAAANFELGRAARMKDEFLATVSHELRTPLTGILALSEALIAGSYGAANDQQVRRLEMIQECGRHLLSLINDILDVAKSEAGRMELILEPVQVGDVCLAALRLVQNLAAEKQQQASFTLEHQDLTILADARRLKQILVNLLGNAIKFTPSGGNLGLHVYADAGAQTVTFCVWDQGIGIAASRVETIFVPFVQVESDFNRSYNGSGLGLALVSKLAALHGGSVRVESEPGSGSSFYVVLPWRTVPATSTHVPAGSPDMASPAPQQEVDAAVQPGPLILLVEDNEFTRTAVQEYLAMQGWEVITAQDGYEAVHLAASRQPDLILMDIQMAGMDGAQAIREIRASAQPAVAAVPIVVLTAHARTGAREEFLEVGANGYVSKPFRLADLRAAVAAQLPQAVPST